jgi:ligand-binding sensor domain-containing protein/serine phosphatase RsbU (regulator of sigma subunit)
MLMIILRRLYLISILFFFHALNAQHLRFRHITSEDGLSTNSVGAIIRDDRGFMWFGTQDGLNKYDGFQFKVFKNDPTDKSSLLSSDVTSLLQIRPDLILVGTTAGVHFFDPVTEKFIRPAADQQRLSVKVNCMARIDSGHVLVGCDQGIYKLDVNSRRQTTGDFLALDTVAVNIIKTIGGKIYIGTMGSGLWRMSASNRIEKVTLAPAAGLKLPKAATANITGMDFYAGKVYIGTYGYGILRIDRVTEVDKILSFEKHNANSNYVKEFVILNNRIYAATAHGVILYNLITEKSTGYEREEAQFSINSNPCNCIFADEENNLWVGTGLGGVNISFYRSQKFPNSTFKYESAFSNIYSFCETRPGRVLVGGVQTLHEIDLETGAVTLFNKFLETGTALVIEKESDNVFWIGTWGNGVYRYELSTGKITNVLGNKLGGTILSLKRYGDYIYAGSLGDGLFRIDMKKLTYTRFTREDGLPDASVNTIFVASNGDVWLGTYEGGLVKMSGFDINGKLPVKKVYFNTGNRNDIASNSVLAINEDKNGTIWAATSTGLSRLAADTFANFYEKDGLPNTYLYSILKDSTENFWISSNNGIIRFNPLLPVKEISFKHYTNKDGLMNTEYNMGAAHYSSSGMMYFGGARGFNAFRPASIRDNVHAPHAYVIGYKRAGKDVETDSMIAYKKHLSLNWQENYFQFELVALDYTDPARNKFRYKLEGYDQDWSAPTNVRFVSYTQLPGGNYTFSVKAANNDGVWNEKPYSITITIIPPFWKTKTFYVLLVLLGITLVVLFTQYRTRAVKRENRILEQKVAERTRELEEKNHDIMSSIQYARRIQEAILPSKDHIFQKLKKIFIIYRPKDIVSGDFYWFAEKNGVKIFAVVDCTGHGVPGAFMSMIGHNLLHQIVLDKGITVPGEILDHLHRGVQKALRQGQNEINTNDGMDVSMITVNDEAREVKWAGANRPLVLINREGGFDRYEGNKFPVGGAQAELDRVFTTHDIKVQVATMAYMFSDGYADQFGGDRGKKFMVKRFHEVLTTIHTYSADEQKEQLEKNFEEWRQNHEQVDDVLIVGLEI